MNFSTKLTLLLLSVVLLLAGAVYYVVHAFTLEAMETQITDHIEEMAAHTMDEIDKMLFERQGDIQILAGDSIISSGDSTPEDITQRLIEFRDSYKTYVSLSFFDRDRIRIADTTGMRIGEQHHSCPWSEDAIDNDTVSAARDVRIAEDLKVPCFYFAAPVRDKTGKILGAVVSRILVQKLYDILRESFSPYTKMRVKVDLVDREGLLLYSNHNEKGILREKPWRDMEAWASFKSGTKKSGSIRHSHPGEGEYLGVFAREQGYLDFTGNGWTLGFHIPIEDAFAPILRLRERVLFTLSLIMGASLLLILFFSRAVSHALKGLRDAALRIGKGDLDARLHIKSGDEIGQLAVAFNQMAEDLKRSMEALKRTQFVVDHTSDAFFIVDAGARFISVNDAACEIHGYSREELLSMAVHDLCPDFPPARWAENWKEIKVRRSFSFEVRGRRKDGKIIDVEVMQNYIEDNEKEYLYVFVRDITERKKLEEQNKMILERTIDGFWVLDLQGRFLEVNDAYCEMSGYSREELLAMRIPDIEASETAEETAEHVKKVIEEGGDFFETKHRRKDGEIIDVEISANFMDIEGGRLFSFVRDITEKKRAGALLASKAERLAKANAELECFNRLAVGREMKMIELKREINDLLKELGRREKYKIHRPE